MFGLVRKHQGKPQSTAKRLTAKRTNMLLLLLLFCKSKQTRILSHLKFPNPVFANQALQIMVVHWDQVGTSQLCFNLLLVIPALKRGTHPTDISQRVGDPRSPHSYLHCLRCLYSAPSFRKW